MFSGAVIIETIFAWPGVGQLAIQGVYSRDYTLVQGVVVVNTVDLHPAAVHRRPLLRSARPEGQDPYPWFHCRLTTHPSSSPTSPPRAGRPDDPAVLPPAGRTAAVVLRRRSSSLFLLTGAIGPMLAPYDPEEIDLLNSLHAADVVRRHVGPHPRHRPARARHPHAHHLRRPGVAARGPRRRRHRRRRRHHRGGARRLPRRAPRRLPHARHRRHHGVPGHPADDRHRRRLRRQHAQRHHHPGVRRLGLLRAACCARRSSASRPTTSSR